MYDNLFPPRTAAVKLHDIIGQLRLPLQVFMRLKHYNSGEEYDNLISSVKHRKPLADQQNICFAGVDEILD